MIRVKRAFLNSTSVALSLKIDIKYSILLPTTEDLEILYRIINVITDKFCESRWSGFFFLFKFSVCSEFKLQNRVSRKIAIFNNGNFRLEPNIWYSKLYFSMSEFHKKIHKNKNAFQTFQI